MVTEEFYEKRISAQVFHLGKWNKMDIMVTSIVAFIIGIIAALIAFIRKKTFWKILLYGISGLIIGLPIGYVLTPTIVSFF